MKLISLLILFLFGLQVSAKTCKVLALEGGGDKGSYEAGVLNYLFNNIAYEDVDYEVISGVSVGSIGTMAIAQYPKQQQKEAAAWMVDMWRSITKQDVYINWPEGPAAALFTRPSVYDTRVLKKFFQKFFVTPPQRKVSIGTTNANTGEYTRFDDTQFTTLDDFIETVMSSSAMPGLFMYRNFAGSTFIDGGTQINLDIAGGVNRCFKDGFTEDEIIIDVVLSNEGKNLKPVDEKVNIYGIYRTISEINSIQSTFRDITAAISSYPKAQFRYLFLPLSPLPWSLEPINFKPAEIEQMIQQGFADALTIISWGPGVSFAKYLQMEQFTTE